MGKKLFVITSSLWFNRNPKTLHSSSFTRLSLFIGPFVNHKYFVQFSSAGRSSNCRNALSTSTMMASFIVWNLKRIRTCSEMWWDHCIVCQSDSLYELKHHTLFLIFADLCGPDSSDLPFHLSMATLFDTYRCIWPNFSWIALAPCNHPICPFATPIGSSLQNRCGFWCQSIYGTNKFKSSAYDIWFHFVLHKSTSSYHWFNLSLQKIESRWQSLCFR